MNEFDLKWNRQERWFNFFFGFIMTVCVGVFLVIAAYWVGIGFVAYKVYQNPQSIEQITEAAGKAAGRAVKGFEEGRH